MKISNQATKIMILYRWTSSIAGAEQLPSLVSHCLAFSLEQKGYDNWIDRKNLPVDSTELKRDIEDRLRQMKVAVICIGPGDLERCFDPEDFFRFEIDLARQLENEGRLHVVIMGHGTGDWEDFVCGTSRVQVTRDKKLKALGDWGSDLLDYLKIHYVTQFDVHKLEHIAEQIGSTLKAIG
jgi:hypothetical protein